MPEGAPQSGRGGEGFRGRGRGRGRGNSGGGRGRRARGGGGGNTGQDRGANAQTVGPTNSAGQDVAVASSRAIILKQQTQAAAAAAAAADNEGDDDAEVCFICANPVAHHSIAPCNHATCHICGLRMRALYKTKDCAHCRTPAPFVIFTDNAEKRFEEYSQKDITTTDSNIGIKYTNEDIVGDTVLLLRYNCPDDSCDFAGLGWPDLHRHVKSVHRKRMCDLCTRNKKVFTHEHELFSDKELEKHMRRGDDKPGAADQTGFKGHPLCGFCGERFYDDDKLYEHCRMKHERCFLCDRRDSRTPHYYQDYNALEQHFKRDHFLCSNSECMEKKFVVFDTELDLQAHNLSDHAGRGVGRDARLVDMSSFDIRQSYQNERRGQRDGEGRGRGRRGGGRGRDPNEDAVPPTSSQPLRRDELALQRQMAVHSAQSVSNRTFGGQLSAPSSADTRPTPSSGTQTPTARNTGSPSFPSSPSLRNAAQTGIIESLDSLTITDPSNLSPEERARIVRHSYVVERAANLLGNNASKISTFRQQISTYRQGGFSAPQLIDAFFTLFADVSSNALGSLVREVADLFEDKTKADSIRKAWQDWRAINEDYPSLPGLGGMHGATSSSSGWAHAATSNPALPNAAPVQKHSNRVLRLKNSTRLGGPTPASIRTPPSWMSSSPVVKSSTTSSSAFPSLPSASGATSSSRSTWAGSSSSQQPQRAAVASSASRSGDAFPALPAAPKPTTTIFGYGSGRSVRRDYGHAESNFQWGGAPAETSSPPVEEEQEGKGKKGGKKGKKVLVQWG
ncbi:hypothetical protein QQS21_003116 [Conoideocrella luteorostrata]|uniref:RING-type E3 ubiquitin transferase n=1 Tax=Conoideocrella luteorostrata TaxID=1105319 RepID=A0AAJ0G0T4_9HYPO|nr:hypothetical protein QQS21_003116 [Conoideocrella luteorostrata]